MKLFKYVIYKYSLTGRTIQFNMAKMLPDVVLETNIGPSSMTVLPPGIGFR